MYAALSTPTTCQSIRYQRRRPEQSTLYRIVAEHAETVFAEAEASLDRGGYPQYVKDEVAAYLRCGLLQHGFARFACKTCGEERLVAYSCKNRGLCPSCIAKRSALTAAHLVDAVLPVCPYRQWTLSLPYVLRFRLIRDGALFTKVIHIFVRTVLAWQRRQAKKLGYPKVHTGSVTFAQRFGSLLQLNPHAHTWIPDGFFVEQDDGELSFVPLPRPTDEDIEALCQRMSRRITKLCAGDDEELLVDDEDAVMASVQAEAVRAPIRRPHFFDKIPEPKPRPNAPLTAQHDGFSLHAGLWVEAKRRKKLERLLRYGSRPPFAQKRLSLRPSGKVRLELRKPYYTGQTELLLEPTAFLRRLFAIIPPPRWHLTRYHGIFSGHHRMRRKLSRLLPEPPPPPIARQADSKPEAENIDDEQPPSESRIPYARLLSRVFEDDIGRCHRCGGDLRLVACIDDPDTIEKILTHLELPTEMPPVAPARSPPQAEFPDWDNLA